MSAIAIIDTGISPHLDLVIPRNRIVAFTDIINNRRLPYDDNGHGTFMAGMVAGNGIMSGHKIISPAKDNNLYIVKAIDSNGRASIDDIIKGINIIRRDKNEFDIRVTLMSFGTILTTEHLNKLYDAIERLYDDNVIIVSASGNGGINSLRAPACSKYVISIGAVDDDLNICDFTSRGVIDGRYKPDFYAIGKNVIGIDKLSYTKMSGTSVAAPYIASIVSIIKDELSGATLNDVTKILRSLAVHKNDIYII